MTASVPADCIASCKRCHARVDELALFPGRICVTCYERVYDAMVRLNGGKLPRPDFSKIIKEAK